MDELNQENQDVNKNDIEQAKKPAEQNLSQENPLAQDIRTAEEKPTEEPKASELTEQANQSQAEPKEENFYHEENYYDTHPLPQQAPPVYQQGYIPQMPQQPYGQPFQPAPQQYQQAYQQQPYMPQQQVPYPQQPPYPQQAHPYRPQPQQGYYQQPNCGQFVQPPQQPQQPPKYAQPNYYTAPKINEPNSPKAADRKNKGLSAGAIVGIIIAILLVVGLICAVAILDSNGKANGNNSTSQADSKNKSSDNSKIEIPVQSKPDVEEKYKDTDGRYTTQGIAKVVSPSVVGVVIYGKDQALTPISQASGIIITKDGYIITNAHVVEGANAQKVILSDEKEYEAKIIGVDTKSDLAVLKITPKGDELVPAQLGDSSQIELGEQVMAIGNPGGLSNSISGGFVSGLNRQIKGSDDGLAMNCIQTDAAVNPGNSGGALVNMYGQVVGIISSKLVATDYEGIGFAIAINDALPICKDIMAKGYVSGRVRIGIVFQELSDTDAAMNDVKAGLYISEIDPSCDIATSGLKAKDIITEMNGKKVYDHDTVMEAIKGMKPGDTVTAKVYRKTIVGEESEFEIKFKLMEDTPK